MPTDRAYLKQAQAGHIGSIGASDPIGAVNQAHEETFLFSNVSGSPLAEVGIVMQKACIVKSIQALPAADLATHAANYITGTVAKRDGAGGAASTIGSFTTNSSGGAALADFEPTTVSVDAAYRTFAAGNVLTYKLVDAATTTEPQVTVSVTVEYV
jgi:hypothetical protein